MVTRKENHYGVDVVVSLVAERGRKDGCLCIHKEGDNYVKCRHLLENDRYKNEVRERIKAEHPGLDDKHVEEMFKDKLVIRAVDDFREFCQRGGTRIAPDGVCRPALFLYLICVSANMATATARCLDCDYVREQNHQLMPDPTFESLR